MMASGSRRLSLDLSVANSDVQFSVFARRFIVTRMDNPAQVRFGSVSDDQFQLAVGVYDGDFDYIYVSNAAGSAGDIVEILVVGTQGVQSIAIQPNPLSAAVTVYGDQAQLLAQDSAGRTLTKEAGASSGGDGTNAAIGVAAVQLAAQACRQVVIQADPNNTAQVLVGLSNTPRVVLEAGDSLALPVANLNQVWAQAASGVQTVNWTWID